MDKQHKAGMHLEHKSWYAGYCSNITNYGELFGHKYNKQRETGIQRLDFTVIAAKN